MRSPRFGVGRGARGAGDNSFLITKMSSSTECSAAFSDDCKLFAYSSPDGRLKIWDTDSGTLKQEYVPSSHLSAAATCLSWRGQVRLLFPYIPTEYSLLLFVFFAIHGIKIIVFEFFSTIITLTYHYFAIILLIQWLPTNT